MKLCLRCNQYFADGMAACPRDNSVLESVGKDPLIGALINDRYVVDSVIGKGSSGIVYKATRLMMGREVAVKVLHSFLGADSGSLPSGNTELLMTNSLTWSWTTWKAERSPT
jgi:serine/threonine protein kinase